MSAKVLAIARPAGCIFAMIGAACAQQKPPPIKAVNPNPELVAQLTKELKITPDKPWVEQKPFWFGNGWQVRTGAPELHWDKRRRPISQPSLLAR